MGLTFEPIGKYINLIDERNTDGNITKESGQAVFHASVKQPDISGERLRQRLGIRRPRRRRKAAGEPAVVQRVLHVYARRAEVGVLHPLPQAEEIRHRLTIPPDRSEFLRIGCTVSF